VALMTLQDAGFDYGREKIIHRVNLTLEPGAKYALVGANGAGKTTLLSLLVGDLELQSGARQVTGAAKVMLLRQGTALTVEPHSVGSLRAVVADAAFMREHDLERRLAEISTAIAAAAPDEHEELARRQGRLQEEFEHLGGYTIKSRLETALRGVGLRPETWDTPVADLSGGERRRAALAQVLLSRADLLLLDEPTNHLDLESCEWLEGFLRRYPGTVLTVSHDRFFLDRTADITLHLDRGRLLSYAGNYSFFDKQSALRHRQDLATWQRQQVKIKQTEEFIRKNIEGQKTKQAQSRRKQLAKEERLERPATEAGNFRFALQPLRPSGGTALEIHQLGKKFDERVLFKNLDLHISRGDRIGILGPNGCGKSTLLKIIAGQVIADWGRVQIGHNVDLGFYDQELSGVSDHNTVLAEMMAVDPAATLGELRNFLGAFGFGADLYDRQVAELSGGERGRLALLRLIKEGHNTLLLDEPTNHLDIRSRESLEAALQDFPGTMLVVSHDRRFLDKLVNRLVIFPAGNEAAESVRVFDGSYQDFLWQRSQAETPPRETIKSRSAVTSKPTPTRPGLSKNEARRRQEWIATVEQAIVVLEAEQAEALATLAEPKIANDRRLELTHRVAEIAAELAAHFDNWEKWSLELEE